MDGQHGWDFTPTHYYYLKGLCHSKKCLYSEAYHEQMGPIPSSNGNLDIALSKAHTWSPRRRTFYTVDATELASR